MRLDAKLRTLCLAGMGITAVLAAGEALARGRGYSAVGGHRVVGSGLGAGLGQHWVGGHGRHVGYGGRRRAAYFNGYGRGGYGGGYYGGGGVYYDDPSYYHDYTPDRPTAYSAATNPAPNYYPVQGRQLPVMVYPPPVGPIYAPVATYRPYQHIIHLHAAQHCTLRKRCNRSAE